MKTKLLAAAIALIGFALGWASRGGKYSVHDWYPPAKKIMLDQSTGRTWYLQNERWHLIKRENSWWEWWED